MGVSNHRQRGMRVGKGGGGGWGGGGVKLDVLVCRLSLQRGTAAVCADGILLGEILEVLERDTEDGVDDLEEGSQRGPQGTCSSVSFLRLSIFSLIPGLTQVTRALTYDGTGNANLSIKSIGSSHPCSTILSRRLSTVLWIYGFMDAMCSRTKSGSTMPRCCICAGASMSTKVGLFAAAAFPPALSSGNPARVRSCVVVLAHLDIFDTPVDW